MVVGLRAEERSRTDPGFVGHEAKNCPPPSSVAQQHIRDGSAGAAQGQVGWPGELGERAQEPGGFLSLLTHRSQAHSQCGTAWRT